MHLAHLAVPFLIGNAFCSTYEDISKDIRNVTNEFVTGEKKLVQKRGWDRDESNMESGIN